MRDIDRALYKLYLFCLPLGQLFKITPDGFLLPWQFSTIIMMLGFFRIVVTRPLKTNEGIRAFGKLYLYMAAFSLLASVVLSVTLDTALTVSPLRRCLGDVVLYLVALCSICYNYYGVTKLVSIAELLQIFKLQTIVLLIVGLLQLGTLFGIGTGLYSVLCSVFALRDVVYLTSLDRGITFFGTEPAASSLICYVVIPFILFSISTNKGFGKLAYIAMFAIMTLLFLLSNSSSALLSFMFVCIVYVALYVFKLRIKKMIMYSAFIVGLMVAILYSLDLSSSDAVNTDKESLEYVLVGKLQDKDNMSTAMRASTVINDMKIFYDYPFTGVGDGNQGYFYRKNVPMWVVASEEVQSLMHGTKIANGGGNFFPSFVSAYGLIGVVFFLFFLKSYRKAFLSSILTKNMNLQMIYTLGMSLFLLTSWYVTGVKLNETICFLLALPCVEKMRERECYTM